MSNQVAKNVPNFIPMGQAGGERVKQDEPVELDGEGKPINPHIPQFISKAPWYLDSGSAKSSLKHQRLSNHHGNEDNNGAAPLKNDWYRRDQRTAGPAATKYRKGACENCGAATHKTKDCLDRPRKVGAKWSGRDIQADEVVQTVATSWDSKRDRANGYDFDQHALALQTKFDRLAALRAERGLQDDSVQQVVDQVNPVSVADITKSSSNTHMRIREDTANYLRKDVGQEDSAASSTAPSAGNTIDKADFVRPTSSNAKKINDAAQFEKLQAFAWQESKPPASHNNSVSSNNPAAKNMASADALHAQAMPSQAALAYKQQLAAKQAAREEILQRYGNESKALPAHLLELNEASSLAHDVAASSSGRPASVNGTSKYPEDIFVLGHTSVWGSWYDKETGKWGYRCCKVMDRDDACPEAE